MRMTPRTVTVTVPVLALLLGCALSCGDDGQESEGGDVPRGILAGGAPQVAVAVAPDAPAEVFEAAAELTHALSVITGVQFAEPTYDLSNPARINILVGAGAGGEVQSGGSGLVRDAYRITSISKSRRWWVTVRGGSPVALQYGVYDLCRQLGARYLHPEQTHYPLDPGLELPLPIERYQRPDLLVRGFQHQTRHPIPFADFLLRAEEVIQWGEDEEQVIDARVHLGRYLLWLVRNRANVHQFEILDSVNLEKFIPFITTHIDRAHSLGIDVGAVVSFTDELERSFRLVEGQTQEASVQIKARLDQLLAAPFDQVLIRLSSTPLSRPSSATVLGWIEVARAHLAAEHPDVELRVQVSPRSDVPGEGGVSYFHAPAAADPSVTLQIQTHVPYALKGPAPLLGGQTFEHQLALFGGQSGQRKLIYAPQTSAWQGFDLDVPLLLPLVGLSHTADLSEHLAPTNLLGQIVLTSGDAFGSWLWDLAASHFAWDRDETFEDFLRSLEPVLGPYSKVLHDWALVQREWLIDKKPELLFYLTGERSADEIGISLGAPLRPLRPLLLDIVHMSPEAYQTWEEQDYHGLIEMRAAHGALLEDVAEPEAPKAEDDRTHLRVQRELDNVLRLYLTRIDLCIAAFELVRFYRAGAEDDEKRKELEQAFDAVRSAGKQRLEKGKAFMLYDKWLLAGERSSPTAYRAGYLHETLSGTYWDRRRDEVEDLKLVLKSTSKEGWKKEVSATFRLEPAAITMTRPSDPVAGEMLRSLVPPLLVGVHAWPAGAGNKVECSFGLDRNRNGLPELDGQVRVDDGVIEVLGTKLAPEELVIAYRDTTGDVVGELVFEPGTFWLNPTHVGGAVVEITGGRMNAKVNRAKASALLRVLSGYALDQSGADALLARLGEFDPASGEETFTIEADLGAFEPIAPAGPHSD